MASGGFRSWSDVAALMAHPHHRLLSESGLVLASRVYRLGIGFITAALFSRLMTVSHYGLYSYVVTIVMLLSVPAEGGMPQLITREVARGRAAGALDAIRGIIRFSARALTLFLATTLVGGMALVLVWRDRLPSGSMFLAVLVAATVAFSGMSSVRAAILRGLGSPVLSQLPEQIIRPSVLGVLGLAVMVLTHDKISAGAGMAMALTANAVAFIVGAILLHRVYARQIGPGPATRGRAHAKALLPFTALAAVQIASAHLAVFIAGFFVSHEQIALLRIGVLCSDVISIPALAMNSVVAARFSALHQERQLEELARLARTSARLCLVLSVILGLPFLVMTTGIIRLTFGADYVGAADAVRILVVGQMLAAVFGSTSTFANISGLENQTLRAVILGLAINCGLTVVLTPTLGIVGAASAIVCGLIAWKVVLSLSVKRTTGLSATVF